MGQLASHISDVEHVFRMPQSTGYTTTMQAASHCRWHSASTQLQLLNNDLPANHSNAETNKGCMALSCPPQRRHATCHNRNSRLVGVPKQGPNLQ
jgi:hypothetical protein